ncbi:hypothetical protein CHU32_11905 [Superficieibacter electus]|uniref:Ricin B lectin domain-containing protein n=1 Tax=Superficieibacter electus TaxID=2022662 RepID=A0A2P5GQI6_9ENTR|nr:RICIN domain-containing protein [Superficieibacter electus]POP45649.1 hypothetical protein CHU33_08975 [Superficieibacter electus]POP48810.1 hypothetical protein CHU32_11905 [Superficieibacter electus]
MIGFFKYVSCPNMVIGISDQQTGSQLVLKPINSELRKILWNMNMKTGEIVLAASDDMVMDTNGGSSITLQQRSKGKLSQQWDIATTRGFIRNKQYTTHVIDSNNRGTHDNNPVILYPYNGSEAQQWKFVPMDEMSVNILAEEVMAEDEPSHA